METTRRGLLGALAAAAAGTVAGCSAPSVEGRSAASEATPASAQAGGGTGGTGVVGSQVAGGADTAYGRVYEATIPSVGLVRTYDRSGALGQGSAFVLRVGGETALVTNQHVVEGARDVTVQFRDGEWRLAEVLGTDVYSDLAALRVADRPAYARPLSLVDSEPGVGTAVAALGAPFGFGESVSSGIVSGQNRSLPSANNFRIADAVQTDAPINPGNSGGPLVTLDGDVAGVVSAGGGDNIGFAISAALVRRVVPALVRRGAYEHPYMGVQLRGVTPPVAEANDLPTARGVIIVGTPPGGPADGRLVPSDGEAQALGETVPVGGDVVLALDGVATPTTAALGSYLATETSPGDDLAVLVRRDGRETTVTVTLGTRPPP